MMFTSLHWFSYVGETAAAYVQSAGEYGKAGIEKAAEYAGMKEVSTQQSLFAAILCTADW